MTTPPKTLVVIATYNELENLPSLVEAIQQHAPHADLLVVDDNSPDGTGRWCDERAANDARLTCLHRAGKLGLGSASYDAFRYAIAEGYEIVATLDADWSHPPDRLPALLAGLQDADVVIGSRYCPGGDIEGWPVTRRVASWLLNAVARRALRLPLKDCSGAFRAYRVEKLREVDFDNVLTQGYAYLEELLWLLRRRGATFVEVPITFRDRQAGASKINWREATAAVRVIATLGRREWFSWRRS
jgi:dolichol-phosphate mannosyltransferase